MHSEGSRLMHVGTVHDQFQTLRLLSGQIYYLSRNKKREVDVDVRELEIIRTNI